MEVLRISGHFFDGFLYAPPAHPFIGTPIFRQIKTVDVVHMSCKFHSHLTCNSQNFFKNSPKKLIFVVGFQNFFDHALLCPKGHIPVFGQMKGLMEIHNPDKFH